MMNSLGQISNRGLLTQRFVTRLQSTSSSVMSTSEIEIPIKKERGPTDILRALANTIKRDPTAYHYKYHDDPCFTPLSTSTKRSFALSQEAGRKAAMWIRETHADLFQHRVADPVIESFLPKAVYDKKEDVNEEILKNAIVNGNVTDALTIYKLLEENTTIETKQSLLELLCYYNNSIPYSEEFLEENWFKKVPKQLSWKECAETEKLFTFLIEQNIDTATHAYNTMICGTSKYIKVDRAWELFNEAQKKQIPLYLITYNHLITTISFHRDNPNGIQSMLIEMFDVMKKSKIRPNIHTFNSALKVTSTIFHTPSATQLCRTLFTEFKNIGIKPSLTSYNYALRIFYRRGATDSSLLKDIIDEIEGQVFDISEQNDTLFFVYAMEIASSLEDAVLGDRIHKLLLTGTNYNFLINAHRESIYYRYYLILQLKNRPFDEFVKSYYNLVVPNIYIPESSVINEILDAITINEPDVTIEFLAQLWSHIVQFRFLENKNLIVKVLTIMQNECKPPEKSPMNKIFSDAAWTVWDFVMKGSEEQKIHWNGPILANIAVLLLRGDEIEKCIEIISYFNDAENTILETPEASQIQEIFDACIRYGYPDAALDLLNYCLEVGMDGTEVMARNISGNLSLTKKQEHRLKRLVGSDSLEIPVQIVD